MASDLAERQWHTGACSRYRQERAQHCQLEDGCQARTGAGNTSTDCRCRLCDHEIANEERPLSEIIALAQQATADLRDLDDDGQRDYYRASEFLPGVVDTIDSKFNETAPTGLSTGLKDLDALVRGGRPGNMIVVGGLTGSGKAILGL